MKYLLLIYALGGPLSFAKEAIDLGELKVKGDMRRPSVQHYQLKSLHSRQLLEISELTFAEFEKELLKSLAEEDSE